MDIETLKKEYIAWRENLDYYEQSEELLFAFLMEHDLLKLDVSRDEYIRRRANHQLIVTLYTDGDYICDMKHPKLLCCEDYVYTLCMGWEDKEAAIAEAISILTEMKKHTHSHRDWVQEDLDEFFDRAIDDIRNRGFAQRDIGGNYEGTRICFVTNAATIQATL